MATDVPGVPPQPDTTTAAEELIDAVAGAPGAKELTRAAHFQGDPINAFTLVDADGAERFVRFRFEPEAGVLA